MQEYQRIILAGPTIDGPPGLPAEHVGLDDATLADIGAFSEPCPEHLVGIGYWPIQPADPTPEGKVVVSRDRAFVEGVLKWVEVLEDAPPEPFPVLTGRQVAMGLRSIGITEAMVDDQIIAIADARIAAADEIVDPTERLAEVTAATLERDLALIEWRRAGLYERDHPLVAELADVFALPKVEVDTLWRWAAGL